MTHDTANEIDWKAPVIWVFAICFGLEAWFNAVGLYEFAGSEDSKARALAGAGLAVAFAGAWVCKKAVATVRSDGWTGFACLLAAAGVAAFLLSQILAHRVFGVTMSDGGLRREIRGDNIASLREELKKIGITRPVAAIQHDIDRELYRKGNKFPDGNGPEAKKLKSELATAERKAAIEEQIKSAGKGGIVKAGAENSIAGALTGMSPEQNQLLVIVLLCALVGFFGTFGFALHDLTKPLPPRGPDDDGWDIDDMAPEARPFGPQGSRALHRIGRQQPNLMLAAPAAPGGAAHGASPASAHASSAPVTINIGQGPGGFQVMPQAGNANDVPGVPVVPPSDPWAGDKRSLAAIPGDAPPVDRSRVSVALSSPAEREVGDVMLAFRAACVQDTPGGIVSLDNLYKRYARWAGERAVTFDAFRRLFPKLTGVSVGEIAGFPHAHGVALRMGAAVKVA